MARPKKPYDPEKHCGAPPAYRNKETLTTRIQSIGNRLKHLDPGLKSYTDKKDYYQRVIKTLERQLAELIANPDDRPCMNSKGCGTDHEGEGKCFRHCQCHGRRGYHDINGNLYTQIRNRRLQDALKLVELQTIDIMDLTPEAKMLKAMTVLFFEDVQRKKSVGATDLTAITNLIDKTGKTIERINAIQMKAGVVTFAAVTMLTAAMGNVMAVAAQNQDGQPFDAQKFIEEVRANWGSLSIDADAKMLPLSRADKPAV